MVSPEEIVNATAQPAIDILSTNGILFLIFGVLLAIVSFYIVFHVLRNFIANAIIGGVGLIVLHFSMPFFMDVSVPLNLTTILIAVVAGLPGLIILLLMTFFGLL